MNPFATHIPALLACLEHTSGPVLELGSGWFSMPIVSAFATDRLVRTIETNPKWYLRVSGLGIYQPITRHRHQFLFVPDYDDAPILGCPADGVPTGATFVQDGETGVLVDRLPPGAHCAESDEDLRALAVFIDAIEQAQALDRQSVRDRAAEDFESDRIVDDVITGLCATRQYAAGVERTTTSGDGRTTSATIVNIVGRQG